MINKLNFNISKDIIERINILLKQKKISRKKMCKDLNLNYGRVSNWFTRRSYAGDGKTLSKIARYLDVEYSYLFLGKSDKKAIRESLTTEYPYHFFITELKEDGKIVEKGYLVAKEAGKVLRSYFKVIHKEQ